CASPPRSAPRTREGRRRAPRPMRVCVSWWNPPFVDTEGTMATSAVPVGRPVIAGEDPAIFADSTFPFFRAAVFFREAVEVAPSGREPRIRARDRIHGAVWDRQRPWTRPPATSSASRDRYTILERVIEAELVYLQRLKRSSTSGQRATPSRVRTTVRIYNLLVHGKLYEQIPVHERVLPIVEG